MIGSKANCIEAVLTAEEKSVLRAVYYLALEGSLGVFCGNIAKTIYPGSLIPQEKIDGISKTTKVLTQKGLLYRFDEHKVENKKSLKRIFITPRGENLARVIEAQNT